MHAIVVRSRPWLSCAAALLLASLVHGTASASMQPHERDGWMFGVGLGGGSAAVSSGGQTSNRELGTSGSLRGHYFVSPMFSLGGEGNMWFKTIDGVDWTFSTFTAAAAVYPGEGFLLRGGVGGGNAKAAVTSGNQTSTVSESGFGFTGGLAYEIRLGRSFALAPHVDYSHINLDSFDANFVSFGLAGHFYILP